MNNQEIPIVWGADEKYVFQTFVVMHSVLSNSDKKYRFYIITTNDISSQVSEYMLLLKSKYNNFEVSVEKIDSVLFKNAKIYNEHLTVAAYFRLLIPKFLNVYDKCIYLDCDVMVNGDIEELYNIDLGDNYVAGVKDCHVMDEKSKKEKHREILGISSMDKYINSGVLLIDLKKMREEFLVDRFIQEIGKEFWYEDQDILNLVCYPYIKILPLKYNLFHFYCGRSISLLYHLDYEQQDFEFQFPFIVHMGGKWKPWNSKKVKYANKWWDYAEIFKDTVYYKQYEKISRITDHIQCIVDALEKNKERFIVLWGYSQNGKQLCDFLLSEDYTNIIAYVDNDRDKQGKTYNKIPVMDIEQILNNQDKNTLFWIVTSQMFFDEIKSQLMDNGVDEQYITRYINIYSDRMYFRALDEKFYGQEIDIIAQYEYAEIIPIFEKRKEYIYQIVNYPESFQTEYNYLDNKYHFSDWYCIKKDNIV